MVFQDFDPDHTGPPDQSSEISHPQMRYLQCQLVVAINLTKTLSTDITGSAACTPDTARPGLPPDRLIYIG